MYFTRSQSRDEASSSNLEQPDPFHYDELPPVEEGEEVQASDLQEAVVTTPTDVATPQVQVTGSDDDLHKEITQFVGILALNSLRRTSKSKRKLKFDVLPKLKPRTIKPPQVQAVMAQPAPQNPKVRSAKYARKSKQDPDGHVAQFETRWLASGFDGMYGDLVKEATICCNLGREGYELVKSIWLKSFY